LPPLHRYIDILNCEHLPLQHHPDCFCVVPSQVKPMRRELACIGTCPPERRSLRGPA
jgi:hypothetical protein